MKNAFYSFVNVFLSGEKTFYIWRNASIVVPRYDEKLSSRFITVLFCKGQDRIPSKWDHFLGHSVVEYLRMDSSNWWTGSRQSNIILGKQRTFCLLFPKVTNPFPWTQKINFWEKNVFYRPFHKLNEMILLYLQRTLISSDCVSQHFINMKSSSCRLSRTMTENNFIFSLMYLVSKLKFSCWYWDIRTWNKQNILLKLQIEKTLVAE